MYKNSWVLSQDLSGKLRVFQLKKACLTGYIVKYENDIQFISAELLLHCLYTCIEWKICVTLVTLKKRNQSVYIAVSVWLKGG